MKKTIINLIALSFLSLIVFFMVHSSPEENPMNSLMAADVDEYGLVCFSELCLDVEIASTPEEKSVGLMYGEGLEEGKGMLFPFDTEARHGFWMKDMGFPIDIIWISSEGVVVHIERSVPPCPKEHCGTYVPEDDAMYVLETRANLTAENGIVVGSEALIYTP